MRYTLVHRSSIRVGISAEYIKATHANMIIQVGYLSHLHSRCYILISKLLACNSFTCLWPCSPAPASLTTNPRRQLFSPHERHHTIMIRSHEEPSAIRSRDPGALHVLMAARVRQSMCLLARAHRRANSHRNCGLMEAASVRQLGAACLAQASPLSHMDAQIRPRSNCANRRLPP